MRPWRRPSVPRANWDTRVRRGSSTPCCGAFSASASRCSRKSMRTSRPAPRIRAGSRPRSSATGQAGTRRFSMRTMRTRRSGCASTRGGPTSRHSSACCEAAGFSGYRDPLAPDALRVEPAADVHSLPGFAEALVSVQDAAAQLAIELLAPLSGERILDACAAPGGKTCHILERTEGGAEVTAVDASAARLERVRANLDRLGLAATLVTGDALRPDAWWDGRPYDRILLDVPCSATGVIRRHPDIKLLRRPGDVKPFERRQRAMLEALWPTARPGGRLALHELLGAEGRECRGGPAPSWPTRPPARTYPCRRGRLAAEPGPGRPGSRPAPWGGRHGRVLLCLPRQAGLTLEFSHSVSRGSAPESAFCRTLRLDAAVLSRNDGSACRRPR